MTIFNHSNQNLLEDLKDIQPTIIYADPPYNTGNKFKYNDNNKDWFEEFNSLVKNVSIKLDKNGVFIVSISEDSLYETMTILKTNFKFFYEPLIWLTKSPLNQNKTTAISSICHEYILIASNIPISSNLERYGLFNTEIGEIKLNNYPLLISFEEFTEISVNSKTIKKIDNFTIEKHNGNISNILNKSFSGHIFQKRTVQNGHGSSRYLKMLQELKDYNEKSLYAIPVNDKQGLNIKFMLGNSYFQSISSNIDIKIPSFLGFYQPGILGFQTAKPVELMKRIFKAFENKNKNILIDLFLGSGNCSIAGIQNGYEVYAFEVIPEIEQLARLNIDKTLSFKKK